MSLLLPHSIDCTSWLRFPAMHPAIHPEALFCQWRLCRHRVGIVKRMLIFFHYPRGLPLHDGKLPIPSTTAAGAFPCLPVKRRFHVQSQIFFLCRRSFDVDGKY